MKKYVYKILRIIGYIIGFSILLYPAISNYMDQKNSSVVITEYGEQTAGLSEEEEQQMLARAVAYNQSLTGDYTLTDPFSQQEPEPEDSLYTSLLSLDDTGMMGYIEIPGIKVFLPIYHGTAERVIQAGVGHLENTSLPVGGAGSHCVLSGHRGLPSAKLFTDLDKVEKGDIFYIKVLRQTYAYEVNQILTVEPEQTRALEIEPGRDYVTLVTCTPYGVNTHRLLVRGERIPYEEALETTGEMELKAELPLYVKALFVAGVALLVIYIGTKLFGRKSSGRK